MVILKKRMIIESEIEFEGIDYDEISKFLGEHLTKEEVIDENLEDLVYRKKEERKKTKSKSRKKTLDTKKSWGTGSSYNDAFVSDDEPIKLIKMITEVKTKFERPWTPKRVGAIVVIIH